ncbi:MAG: transporter substrate-binding domain-containing protein [Xenococcaceae cyanobacterium MO_188.B29]|nr:transporter substrate-binding domain-containing protein [Xenococcaceae cyanobacterium MO_188.B29]
MIVSFRSALLLAATDSEGLSAINVIGHFPTEEIKVNTDLIFSVIKEKSNFLRYNETTVRAISQQANSEIVSGHQENLAQLPDLRHKGSYSVTQETRTFAIDRVRQTQIGFTDSYNLDTDIYLPVDLTKPAPLVIITHGFGSSRSDFQYLGKHLASHGYIVLIPEHIGSNSDYKKAFLRGELSVDVSPIEFYSRPQDITYLLDAVEKDAELTNLINWEQVGILGHSFGGNTALAIAGAPINQERINQVCQKNQPSLNISMLLQCRASGLPPGDSNLRDDRIKAVVAANPVTSSIFGIESMGKIQIPTMMLAGSHDTTTPFITEQAHPFLWLNTQNKYLGLMAGGTHGYLINKEESHNLALFNNPLPELRRSYLKAMSLAFFEVYVRNRSDYQPYLSSAYAQTISDRELPLYLIQSLTPEQLEQAYGATPPIPPIPESLVAASPTKTADILAEIRDTKTLKIAMRSNAAPFGYIDDRESLWTGYCGDFAESLAEYLEEKLDIAAKIKVVKLPSSLQNRFELVKDKTVHLECGPNTIVENKQDISFSNPFFISGTRFLVNNDRATKVNLDGSLEGLQAGVLENSTTAEFLRETYPEIDLVYFQGKKGRIEGLKAISDGSIDAFVSDGVLLSGEIERQNLAQNNYQLIPENPLTCDFYGLILPKGDRQWNNLVNAFIRSEREKEFQDKWLGDYSSLALADADYCLNRREN